MTQASGASRGDPPGDVHGHRDRAQAVRDAARRRPSPGRARPRRARPARRRPGPRGRRRGSRRRRSRRRARASSRSVVTVTSGASGTAGGLLGEHPARSPSSRPASRSCRATCGDPALAAVRQQRPVDQRDPEAAAAENRQLHVPSDHLDPRLAQRGTGRRVRGRVGHHDVQLLGAADPRHARCRGTCAASASRTTCVAGRDHGPLDRHLDDGGVHHLPVRAAPRWCRGTASRRGAGAGCPR